MKCLPLFLLLFMAFDAAAQRKPAPKPAAPKPAVKPVTPVLRVYATVAGKSGGRLSADSARNLLDFPLVLKDEKGTVYAIKQFSFAYRRKNTYEDELGRTGVTYEWLSVDLRNNEQLNELWRSTVKESLKNGEEIHFQKIMADPKKGYLIPVPPLKFEIEKR